MAHRRCPSCTAQDITEIPLDQRSKYDLDASPQREFGRCLACGAWLSAPPGLEWVQISDPTTG